MQLDLKQQDVEKKYLLGRAMHHRVVVSGQSFVIDVDPPRCQTQNKNKWYKWIQWTRCPVVCVPIVRCRGESVDYFDMHFVDNSQPIVIDSLHHRHLNHHRLWAYRWRIFESPIFLLSPPSATAMAFYRVPHRSSRRWCVRCHRCTSLAS